MSQSELKQTADIERFLLTRMERVGLKLAANGYCAQDIATRLGVSEKEMETLLFCAERKLRAKNRLHAVAIAVSQGLIGIGDRGFPRRADSGPGAAGGLWR